MATNETFAVVGVSCSPRKDGNTDIMVQQVLRAAGKTLARVEFLRIAEMEITPCDGCWTCAETGRCHIEDDMQTLYPKLRGANGIVVGSPVHMGYGVSGQAQVFFDRTLSLWHQKLLRDKVGACIAVSNRRGGISVIRTIESLFLTHRMIVAGYANGYGLRPGDIRGDERAMGEASALGERLCDLIGLLGVPPQSTTFPGA